MTIAANVLADNITALSITVAKPDGTTGTLTIKDLDNLKIVLNRDCPILYPQYDFATGWNYERQSVGANPFWQVNWTAHYYYAHSGIGQGRYNGEHSAKISANALAIAEAIAAACTTLGVTEIAPASISEPTIVPGPDDKQFYGAQIEFAVTDYRNM